MYIKFYIFISENSWEKFWISQVISLKTCHLQVISKAKTHWKYFEFHSDFTSIRQMSIRNNWNPVGLRKIYIWIFTCEKADIPYNCLYGVSLVLHLCKSTCPTGFTRWFTSETFFFELKGLHNGLFTKFALARLWSTLLVDCILDHLWRGEKHITKVNILD